MNRMWQPDVLVDTTRARRGRPAAASPAIVDSSTSPKGFMPAMHNANVFAPSVATLGHCTNFVKLYRNAAFTRYSSGTSCATLVAVAPATHARTRNRFIYGRLNVTTARTLRWNSTRRGTADPNSGW